MNTVWMVGSLAQYEALQADPPNGSWSVATNDFEVWLAEHEAGRDPIDLWSYLPDDALTQADDEAFAFCEEVGERFAGRALEGDVDLVVHRRFDLLYTVRALLLTGRAMTTWLASTSLDRIGVFEERSVALFWTPAEASPDQFNAVAAWMAARAALPMETRALPAKSAAVGVAEEPEVGAMAVVPETVDVLSFTEGLASKEQAGLWEWGSGISERSLVVSDRPVQDTLARLHPARLRSIIPAAVVSGSGEGFTFDVDEFVALRGMNEPQVLLANLYINFVWEAFSRWVEEGRTSVLLGQILAQAVRPRVALIGYSIGGAERCLEQGFAAEGVPVVSLDHWASKTYILNRMNTGCHSHVAVSGPFLEEDNRRFRTSGAQSFSVGCLRKDMAELAGREARPAAPPRIVFITSRAIKPDTMTGFARPEGYLRSWTRILHIAERHPEWDFVVKPHPRSDFHSFFSGSFFEGRSNVRLERAPSAEVLPEASIVVLMNTPSWAFPEIAALGLPAVYLNDAGLPIEEMHMKVAGCPRVGAEDDLEAVLGRLMDDSTYREKVVAGMQSFLTTAMVAVGAAAAERLEAALEQVALAEGEGFPPEPYARHFLELVVGVDGFKRAGTVPSIIPSAMADGRFCTESVLTAVLDLLFRVPGTTGSDRKLPAMVRWVLGWFPKSAHPKWSVLRPYFVHAYLQAAAADRGWRRCVCMMRVWLLAPGRLVAALGTNRRSISCE